MGSYANPSASHREPGSPGLRIPPRPSVLRPANGPRQTQVVSPFQRAFPTTGPVKLRHDGVHHSLPHALNPFPSTLRENTDRHASYYTKPLPMGGGSKGRRSRPR